MYRVFGVVLAGGLLLWHASAAQAQVVVGSPWGWGSPAVVAAPGFTAVAASPWGIRTYSSGYRGFVAPAPTVFSSGFAAPGAFVTPVNPWIGTRSFYARPGWGGWGGRRGWGGWGRGWRRW